MAIFPRKTQYSAPITMVVVLVCAIAFAIGHHFFYQNLDGQPTQQDSYMYFRKRSAALENVSDQQINTSIGTFFAFLVKASLGAAVTVAFDQFAWKNITTHTAKVSVIDHLFLVLSNGFWALNYKLWVHYPTSMLLATVLWLLPVASMISPATLNVKLQTFSNHTMMQVPRIEFQSTNMANVDVLTLLGDPVVMYRGPLAAVRQIVTATAAQGEILPITAPSTNSSWTLDFHGPALQCKDVDSTLQQAIRENIVAALDTFIGIPSNSTEHVKELLPYVSWVPSSTSINGSLPYSKKPNATDYTANDNIVGPKSDYGDIAGNDTTPSNVPSLSFYVATVPDVVNVSDASLQQVNAATMNAVVTQCTLYNATYNTNFSYVNGEQSIQVASHEYLNNVPYIDMIVDDGGSAGLSNATLAERLSYQALMESFAESMTGALMLYFNNVTQNGGTSIGYEVDALSCSVLDTVLANAKEFNEIKKFQMQQYTDNPYEEVWGARSVAQTTNSSFLLSDLIEELFQNTTLSLMSSSLLQPNYAATTPPQVKVTMSYDRTVYSYNVSILWTAYGIAIGVSIIAALLGFLAFRLNHASYSTKFSTILRATQVATMSTQIKVEDCSGNDPLPEYIGQADIQFPARRAFKDADYIWMKGHERVVMHEEVEQVNEGWNNK